MEELASIPAYSESDPEQLTPERVYRAYSDKVFRYLSGKVNHRELAQDLTSEVFLKVYEKLGTFDRTKASVSTWVYTITRNTLYDYYRTRKLTEEIPETLPDGSSVEDDFCRAESLQILSRALQSLREEERDIVILHYYSGVTLKDIAVRIGRSYAYVKTVHASALEVMKTFF